MTKRLSLAATAAILCFPASAMAASSAGVVLSVNARQHALQFVNGRHVVYAYHFHGALPGVALGSRVRIEHSGQAISHLAAKRGLARTVSFLAEVVRIGPHGAVVRLADQKLVRLPASLVHSVSRKHHALAKGNVVLVTENVKTHSISPGGVKRVANSSAGGTSQGGGSGSGTASGTVVELDPADVVVHAADGSTLRFAVAASVITNLQLSLCATVAVTYHSSGPTLVADSMQNTQDSPTGQCANAGSGGGSGAPGQDLVGTVTQLTLTSATISTSAGASVSFSATLDVTGGFMIGDGVDVTYNPSGNGALVASDIQYQDQDAVGTVTSVSGGSVTLVDSTTNQTETFTDDPANDTFAGISVGDQVDVSYHVSAAGPVVDSVSDNTNSP